MTSTLEHLITTPGLALAHRMRAVQTASDGSVNANGVPCLILLHGVGSSEASLLRFAQQQDPRLLVILARAPLTLGAASFAWFQVSFTPTGPLINAAQAEQSRQLLIQFIAALPAAYGVDPQRVWIAGFSQGGIMSASVGLTRPDMVRGAGLLSGRILPEIAPLTATAAALQDVQFFVSHGIQDSKLTIEFARSAQRLLQEKQVRLTYREYAAEHELNADMQRDFGQWISAGLDQRAV